MPEERRGKVQTVLGLIDPSELGHTMMHEHIMQPGVPTITGSAYLTEPEDPIGKEMFGAPVTLENLWWIRYNLRESRDNNTAASAEEWLRELELFKRSGGGTITELTMHGPKNLDHVVELSRASGINIVAGAGHFIDKAHKPEARIGERTIDEIAAELIDHVLVGNPETGAKAGLLGELGCSWPLTPNERKVLLAGAIAQRETGVPISIHPGRNEAALGQIRDVLSEGGADLTRVVMGHMDRCGYELETKRDVLDSGITIEYDVFGMEGYYPAAAALADDHMPDMPNDTGRIKQIRELAELGYSEQIVVGHDIHLKYQLATYGGWGYGHYLRNVVPLMHIWELSEEAIRRLTIDNPARMLTIA
ncbi:hypothetical protein [Streptomyces phaeochromogenes]|uniref:phosphotriesterase family protein n=1 Tax=Streptomyces phaeochromogenes TaxID=1923 RepID=UPI002DDC2D34|nr:hypothetical protein [Streptomyces phaeochromogenes]WRZ34547.1 hypothetical protein OG931_45850 [Streptomyces phaeochromogenes]